jgi:hypothetical protein
MSEVQAPVTTEREVTIYATRGGQMKKIMTSVKTWGELQPLVRREGFDLSSLLAAENINKTDLVNDLAVLPEGNFRLFLRPKQTKSGAPDRKECFAIIKAHLTQHPEDKFKFIIDGKNMTQLSTPVVQELVAKYCSGATTTAASNTATEASKTKEKVEKKAEKKEEAPKAKEKVAEKATEVPQNDTRPLTEAERVEQALALVAPLSGYDSYDKVEKHLNRLSDEVAIANAPAPEVREETEEEALAREAREMSAGYR